MVSCKEAHLFLGRTRKIASKLKAAGWAVKEVTEENGERYFVTTVPA